MITIAARLRPFSHSSGAQCVIPGTDAVLTATPDLLKIGHLEIPLGNHPFLRDFTLQQDLERNCVWIFGKDFRIKIIARQDGFEMESGKEKKFFPETVRFYLPKEVERLSLGSNKSQDWDLVTRRMDFKEILPVLFFLGQKIFPAPTTMLSLSMEEFYRSSFHHMLVPRKIEENRLREGFLYVRSLFFSENGSRLTLLPNNPFPEGRMLNIQAEIGSLDIEWTKRRLRRAVLRVRETGSIFFDLAKEIRSFRTKTSQHEKGVLHNVNDPLFVEKGMTVFLDRFFE